MRYLLYLLMFFGFAMEHAMEREEDVKNAIITLAHSAQSYVRTLYKDLSSVKIVNDHDITLVLSDIPLEGFNYVLQTKFAPGMALQRIDETSDFFADKKKSFTWWIDPSDTPSNLFALLEQKGFTRTETYYGMYLTLSQQLKKRVHILEVLFKRVLDMNHLDDFHKVVETGPNEKKIWNEISSRIFNDQSPIELHVGYKDELPVTAGILYCDKDNARISSIATSEAERRKGYGTHLITHLLTQARIKGCDSATLDASMGTKSFYEKFGFRECCLVRAYVKN